jgi:type IV secretory pathway VirJ component
VASILADNGIPVVGLNTLRYFWTRRTPEEAAIDFQRVLNRYLPLWKKDKVVVIGYSFGADVLPFILNRIPKPLLARIEMLVLLAPTRSTDFEFHLRQWFSDYNPKTARAVLPELKELGGLRILAFCGEEDGGALCKDLPGGIKKVLIPRAGHRFDQCYSIIAQDILKEVGSPVKR